MTTKLNVALICSVLAGSAGVAFAQANPTAAVLTVRCGIFDAVKNDGTPDLDARSDCNDVGKGDADHPTVVELYSNGKLIYTEMNPPVENGHDGGTMRIQVTGNGTKFQPWYVNFGTSWVDMPNLQVQIWKLDIDKDGTTRKLVLKNIYLPAGSAVFAQHSDDTPGLIAMINAETARAMAAEAALGGRVSALETKLNKYPASCPVGQCVVSTGAAFGCGACGGGAVGGGCAGQVKTYTMVAANFTNLGSSCGADNFYNGCGGLHYGFHWTDTQGAACGKPTTITVQFQPGLTCNGARTVTSELNTIAGTTWSDPNTGCLCVPNAAATQTISLSASQIAAYVTGGTNTWTNIPAGSCEGLHSLAAASPNYGVITATW